MPTTGKIRSNAIGIFISNESANSGTFSGGTYGDNTSENDTWEIVACATSGTFSGSMEVIDATTKDNDGEREILTSSLSWTMACDGLIEYGLSSTVKSGADLFTLWKNKTKIKLAWTTGVDGDIMYWGKGYITTYEESAGLNEVASFSVNFEGDGTIYKAVLDTNDAVFNNNNN
jgi:TP901-1 family phage major tail protein